MGETDAAPENPGAPEQYEIRIKGHLGSQWTEWFDGLRLTRDANGETRLSGPVVDQAALHGVLRKVRDLGLPLLAVMRIEPGQADTAGGDP